MKKAKHVKQSKTKITESVKDAQTRTLGPLSPLIIMINHFQNAALAAPKKSKVLMIIMMMIMKWTQYGVSNGVRVSE